jgi:CO dehydrogenase maturation factor
MNPRVDDIPEQYGIKLGNIRLLVLGHIPKARGGCACPENIFLRELISHALLQDREIVIMDMEAGIEHLGRGTAQGVDIMLIVVEPSRQSIETARRIHRLAVELGVPRILVVANKIASEEEVGIISAALPDLSIVARMPVDPQLRGSCLQEQGIMAGAQTASRLDSLLNLVAGCGKNG